MMHIDNLQLFTHTILYVISLNIFYALDEEYFHSKKLKSNRH